MKLIKSHSACGNCFLNLPAKKIEELELLHNAKTKNFYKLLCFKNLIKLKIKIINLTDHYSQILSNCIKLKFLNKECDSLLRCKESITPVGEKYFENLGNLEEICIWNVDISNCIFNAFSKCKKLKSININNCKMHCSPIFNF